VPGTKSNVAFQEAINMCGL